MKIENQYESDINEILSHRHDNDADLWTTPDQRLMKGSPFSTLESVMYILELGVEPHEPIMKDVTELIWGTWREDGRFKVYPDGGMYPCQTIHAANALCHMGLASDDRLQTTFQYLLDSQYLDGGWRCNKFSFGRGPETGYSNPLPTLVALDAFRFTPNYNNEPALVKSGSL